MPPPLATGPDIVLVSIDTLRADRLSAWGYDRPTTPNLDSLAKSSLRFDRAVAPAPWTLPSMASLFTGLMPSEHGVQSREWQLSASASTLAEDVAAAGYQTAFFGVNAAFVTGHGLEQGFEIWSPHLGLSGRQLNRAVLAFLGTRTDPRPLFLVVHYLEPHCPYGAPADVTDRFLPNPAAHTAVPLDLARYEAMGDCFNLQQPDGSPELDLEIYRARYDAEVFEVDRLVGELWGAVSARAPWFALVADHGEAFWEHGVHGHGDQLYDEQIRVPMLVRPPGGQAAEVEAGATSTLWLYRAVIAAVNGQPLPGRPGLAFSETDYGDSQLRAVVRGRDKLIVDQKSGQRWGFDLGSDPGELQAVEGESEGLGAVIREYFEGLEARRERRPAERREASGAEGREEERKRLQGLGYVE